MSHQLPLPGIPPSRRVVNVASVPQRSPFRYPGGKTWLVPTIRRWLASSPKQPAEFIEPFAGGAIVGLTVAFEGLAKHVTLVELDDDVSAVWKAILEGEGEWLAAQIAAFEPTQEAVEQLLSQDSLSIRERAFQTIVKNRVSHGGILAPGAGLIKRGESGKGLASRWYPGTLQKRILRIAAIRARITFVQGDGLLAVEENAHREDVAFYIDPPYTAAGKSAGRRLYTHWEIDHERLFAAAAVCAGDFLMTYENSTGVSALAMQHQFDMEPIAMKNTHHAQMTELMIGRNLDWLR